MKRSLITLALLATTSLTAPPVLAAPISGYPAASTLSGSEALLGTQSGVTVRISTSQLKAYAAAGLASNAAMSALPHTFAATVVRTGFAAAGDAPPLTFTSSASACSLNAGAGDGGSQVPTSDGKCWIAVLPSEGVDVRQFGAKLDGVTDDHTAFQNCNTAMPNGWCFGPPTTYTAVFHGGVTVTNGGGFRLCGPGGAHDVSPYLTYCARIVETLAGATAFTFKPASTGGSATRSQGGGLIDAYLDGYTDTGAIGVLIQGSGGEYRLSGQRWSSTIVKVIPVADSPGIGEASDAQHNIIDIYGANQGSAGDGNIFVCDGTAAHNCSFNDIRRIEGYYKNAVGVDFINSDNNDIGATTLYQSAGGSATSGVRCAASSTIGLACRDNHFHRASGSNVAGTTITFEGTGSATYPSIGNMLDILDTSNGATISIGTSATVNYCDNLSLNCVFTGALTAGTGVGIFQSGARVVIGSSATPTVTGTGGGTSPSVVGSTFAGVITIGTGPANAAFTLNLGATTHNWVCFFEDPSSGGTLLVRQTANSSGSVNARGYLASAPQTANALNAGDSVPYLCHGS